MAVPSPDPVLAILALLTFALAYVGASVGLVLGQFRLPVLVWWLGSPVVGASTSLAISTVGALVGALRHALDGRVRLRLMLTIGVPSGLTAYFSARYAGLVSPDLLEAVIGGALVVSGVVMYGRRGRPRPAAAGDEPASAPDADDADDGVLGRATLAIECTIGAVLGALSGLVGLLLGTLRLPLMLRFLPVPPPVAVGSTMAIGALTGVLAGVATLMEGHVDLWAFAVLAPAALLGSGLGARATGRMKRATLYTLIAAILLIVGVAMMIRGAVAMSLAA